ncbi:MAG TPA: hypothetical protein VKR58_09505 [Aquella sp.]|nr:hypothetical protein [Aquella sp.]
MREWILIVGIYLIALGSIWQAYGQYCAVQIIKNVPAHPSSITNVYPAPADPNSMMPHQPPPSLRDF